jgi:dCMP deaminase
VGACIVNPRNKIVSVGYNGMPQGISDDEFPWAREGDPLDTKYPYVCHAELNAILNNIGTSLENCRFTCRFSPAMNAAKPSFSAASGSYLSGGQIPRHRCSSCFKRMMDRAGVTYRRLRTPLQSLTISFREEDV